MTHGTNETQKQTQKQSVVPFIAGCSPLYTEKHKVSCSGFLPKTLAHATFMHPLPCDLQAQLQETHRTTHTGTNHSLQNTEEEPIASGTTAAATRRTHEVPFIAGCSHFTRKNTRFRAPASSPKQSPCNIHASIAMRSASTASRNA